MVKRTFYKQIGLIIEKVLIICYNYKKIQGNKMSDKECRSLANRQIVTQSNSLINGKYVLSDIQQKLILIAISQIDSVNDTQFYKYSCTVSELEKMLEIKINHKQFRESCEDLFKKPIRILKGRSWELYSWFQSIKYINDENRFEFKISNDLVPYLLQLRDNFTKFQLGQALKFSGKYTIRFYQFLMQIRNMKKKLIKFNIAELCELLELPKSLRIYKDFRIKVLEPSLKEINTKSDIKAVYKPIRTGRKYTHIELSWEHKQNSISQTFNARAVKRQNIKTRKEIKNQEFSNQFYGEKFFYKDEIYQIRTIEKIENSEEIRVNCEKLDINISYNERFFSITFLNIDALKGEIERYKINNQKGDKSQEVQAIFQKLEKATQNNKLN